MPNLPKAESLNYWKTSNSAPDTWIERARKIIEKLGGEITGEMFGRALGSAAFMLSFTIESESFRVVWPVLPTKKESDERAAKVQAATMLYHDIKGKCLSAAVFGARVAFFSYLVLPDGRQASEAADAEISEMFPRTILIGAGEK